VKHHDTPPAAPAAATGGQLAGHVNPSPQTVTGTRRVIPRRLSPPAAARPREDAADRVRAALREFGAVLDERDPVTAAPDHALIGAAIAYVRSRAGDDETRLLWSRYAYASAARLVGVRHPLWRQTATLYRTVLTAQGLTFDAVRVCEQKVAVARALGDAAHLHITRCGLASALHEDGQCELADQYSRDVLAAWTAQPGSPVAAGRGVVLTAAAIAAGCRNTPRAVRLLHRHGDVLHGLDQPGRQAAAWWLARSESTHPPRCQLQPPAPSGESEAGREEIWACLLDRISRGDGPRPGRAFPATRHGGHR
jgi:hypothetical protein